LYEKDGIPIAASVGGRTQLRCTVDSDCGGNGALCVPALAFAQPSCSQTGSVCQADSDCTLPGETCLPPSGQCGRLDYSEQTLPTGGATPGALDETNLDDTVGLGSGTADMFAYIDGSCHSCFHIAPTTGPVDWMGAGLATDPTTCNFEGTPTYTFTDVGVHADVDTITGVCDAQDVLHGHTDWPDKGGLPFVYKFQCNPTAQN